MGRPKTQEAPVRLVAWRDDEGARHRDVLSRLGVDVVFEPLGPLELLQVVARDRPRAVIIDLSRSPAKGRDLGVALRIQNATRHIPLVFAGGTPESVATARSVLPDAGFALWEDVLEVLSGCLSAPPSAPVVPESRLAGYSGTPLPRKLGVKAGARVLLSRAPPGFEAKLEPLPDGVQLLRRYGPGVDLILWFVRSRRELSQGIDRWAGRVGRGGMWIIWRKQGSPLASDLKQGLVREAGLAAGLVDYKVAALDEDWSGLKFAVKKGT